MRRKDKQISNEETLKLFQEAEYGILSMIDENQKPYGIPLSFALEDGSIYIHCSSADGNKISCIDNCKDVCFTVVDKTKVIPKRFTTLFMSAIAYGTIEIVKDKSEKQKGIEAIVKKYAPDYFQKGLKVIKHDFNKFHILKFKVDKMTGKGKKN